MRPHVIARKTHKWLGLFVGLQVVLWSLSGLYMTVVHIDTIHGDHLIRPLPTPTADPSRLSDPLALATANEASGVRLVFVRDQPAYALATETGERIVDATTGTPISPLTEGEIRAVARRRIPAARRSLPPNSSPKSRLRFEGESHRCGGLSLPTGTSPRFISRRQPASFCPDATSCGASSTSSGCSTSWTMTSARTSTTRSCAPSPGARVLMALSGVWLLFYSFHRKKKKKKAVRA